MLWLRLSLTSSEWVEIRNAASERWPQETLSRGEVVRRFTLAGFGALKNLSPTDQARVTYQFQSTMTAPDMRLKS